MITFLTYTVHVLHMVFVYLFFENMLERKHGQAVPIIVMAAITLTILLLRIFAIELFIIHALIAYLLMFAYVIVFFKDTFWRKTAAVILMFLGCGFADIIAIYIGANYIGATADFDTLGRVATANGLFLLVICESIWFIFGIVIMTVWKRVHMLKDIGLSNIILFCIFPISQFCLLIGMIDVYDRASIQLKTAVPIGVVLGVFADVVLFYIVFDNIKKKQLDAKIQEMEMLKKTEALHYESIEARRGELSKIRHDFNNHIIAIEALIDSEDFESATEMTTQLKDMVLNTSEYQYCGNSIVNAVVDEKKKQCDSAGISLKYDLHIDNSVPIEKIHLCSIFSNLLDNSIRACQGLPQEQRIINLKASIKGGYIHISTKNATATASARKGGQGLKILADIAEIYDGNLNAGEHDGMFSTMISLLIT